MDNLCGTFVKRNLAQKLKGENYRYIHTIIGKNLGCTVLSERKPDSRLLSEDILERADEKAAPWLRGAGVEMGWAGIVCECWNDSMS